MVTSELEDDRCDGLWNRFFINSIIHTRLKIWKCHYFQNAGPRFYHSSTHYLVVYPILTAINQDSGVHHFLAYILNCADASSYTTLVTAYTYHTGLLLFCLINWPLMLPLYFVKMQGRGIFVEAVNPEPTLGKKLENIWASIIRSQKVHRCRHKRLISLICSRDKSWWD